MINLELMVICYCSFLTVAIVDLMAIIIVSRLLRIEIEEVGLFWFRFSRLTIFNFARTKIKLGLIPFPSGYVQFRAIKENFPARFKAFASLPLVNKMAVSLSGIVLNIIFAASILGFQSAISSSVKGVRQIIEILVSRDFGFYYLRQIVILQQSGWWHTWAVLTTKVVSFNLLPIPGLYGGFILITLWEFFTRTKIEPEKLGELTLVSIIIFLATFLYTWREVIISLITSRA